MTPTQHKPSVADTEFDRFFVQRMDAAEAYVNGDGGPLDALVAHHGEATFHSPSGDTVSGAEAVATRYRADTTSFAPGGRSHFEILQQAVSDDLAFWTGFQVATVQLKDRAAPSLCAFA